MTDTDLRAVIDRDAPSTWLSIGIDVDTGAPAKTAEARRREALDRLEAAGAPDADREAVANALDRVGIPTPATRDIVVQGGDVLVDEVFAGAPGHPDVAGFGPVPDLVPLLRHRAADLRYLLVEVDHEGGEVRSCRTLRTTTRQVAETSGRTENLHKVASGGWSQLNNQERTQEIWKQNQNDVAERVDAVVAELRPAFILVSGDVQARRLVIEQLGEASRELVVEVAANTRAAGASDAAVDEAVSEELDRLVELERDALQDRMHADDSRLGAHGLDEVVAALQQGEVDTLLLAPDGLESAEVLALAGAPWIARSPQDALGADVVGSVPAAVGLARAAIATDARVLVEDEPADEAPGGGVAAALRWAS